MKKGGKMAIALNTPTQLADFITGQYDTQQGGYSVYDLARVTQAVKIFGDLFREAPDNSKTREEARTGLSKLQTLLDKMKGVSE